MKPCGPDSLSLAAAQSVMFILEIGKRLMNLARPFGVVLLVFSGLLLYGWLGSITEECILEIFPRGQIQLCDPISDARPEITLWPPLSALLLALSGLAFLVFTNKNEESKVSEDSYNGT